MDYIKKRKTMQEGNKNKPASKAQPSLIDRLERRWKGTDRYVKFTGTTKAQASAYIKKYGEW